MSQYLKIPRGMNVNYVNDIILQKAVEAIGRRCGEQLKGQHGSDYAKGKIFLSKTFGFSKAALK